MYELLTSTDYEFESCFNRDQADRDSEFKLDHAAAERCHMLIMTKMSDQLGFGNDLEKIIYGLRFIKKLELITIWR